MLVVDDSADTRLLYEEALRFSGFRVEQACDGEEAVERARSLQPDVIVMDFAMPKLDGGQAARRLSEDERTRSIPVLLLSAYADLVPRDVRLHCAAFLAKPCELDALCTLLHLIVAARDRKASR